MGNIILIRPARLFEGSLGAAGHLIGREAIGRPVSAQKGFAFTLLPEDVHGRLVRK